MRARSVALAVSVLTTVWFMLAEAQEPRPKKGNDSESINKKFEDPKLDVEGFVKRFETESREVYANRSEILDFCEIRPGMGVADVGAGTGLYTFLFAEKVRPAGVVYAVDIAPAFLKHISEQAEKKGLAKVVKPIKGGQETTNLSPGSVDLVFICDAYHHFEKPDSMLASIHEALRPGGRVVFIDFDKRPDSSGFIKNHARAEKEVYFKEFEAAGFEKLTSEKAPELKENFIAAFRKLDRPEKP